MRRRVLVVALGVALVAGSLVPGAAYADDPVHVPWSELLPGLAQGYDPSSEHLCRRGDERCVDAVIREMQRRFRPLVKDCDHNAVFALAYLRTTEEYRRTIEDPDFFEDTPFVNHQDAVFAQAYFAAYDDWYRRERRERVPRAWQLAFEASDAHQVSGSGSLLLGMNGHVNQDLPFVLAAIGLVKPDGSSRKRDHDHVNRFLIRVVEPLIAEASQRFDPSMSDSSVPGTTLDETTLFQTLVAWREQAWRNAERLVAADTPEARQRVAASIERQAALEAEAIIASTGYVGPVTSSEARDAHCAVHGGG